MGGIYSAALREGNAQNLLQRSKPIATEYIYLSKNVNFLRAWKNNLFAELFFAVGRCLFASLQDDHLARHPLRYFRNIAGEIFFFT